MTALRYLPNVVTASRAVIAVILLVAPTHEARIALVVWATFSDFLDGWLARRFHWQSAFGAAFDLSTDGLFFLACFLGFWRAGVLPSVWFALILAGSLPELAAQVIIFLRPKRRVGSLGRFWNRLLGAYSYACVIGMALGLAVPMLAVGQAALEFLANGLDLWQTIRLPGEGRPC